MRVRTEASPVGLASVWLDIAAPSLDIRRLNRVLGVAATHYYTPVSVKPKAFAIARSTANTGEECCWQYRSRMTTRVLPASGTDRLVAKFRSKAAVIRRIAHENQGTVTLNVLINVTDKWWDPYAWFTTRTLAFVVDIGGHIVVSAGRDIPPL